MFLSNRVLIHLSPETFKLTTVDFHFKSVTMSFFAKWQLLLGKKIKKIEIISNKLFEEKSRTVKV